MSDGWRYGLSDLPMFTAHTYRRLFELYNADVWPLHLAAIGVGLAVVATVVADRPGGARWAGALLALCWFWVAWAFHLQRYAAIHWAAAWFAGAFAAQGVLLLGLGGPGRRVPAGRAAAGDSLAIPGCRPWRGWDLLRRGLGPALLLYAVCVQPWLGVLRGQPWTAAQCFGLAPDPTALGTLGLLLAWRCADARSAPHPASAARWLLWPIPLSWCLFNGATLWSMRVADALWMPALALAALLAAVIAPSRPRAGSR